MKIQIISNLSLKFDSKHEITYSKISEPKTLASFDVNIFNLQDENLWCYKEQGTSVLDITKDFNSIKNLIVNSNVAVSSVILFPQNYVHRSYYSIYDKDYNKKIALKDELKNLRENLLNGLVPFDICGKFDLIYENSKTKLCDSEFTSSFCFLAHQGEVLSVSCDAEKATTIAFSNIILTTLKLNGVSLDDFIKGIGLEKEKVEYPQWLLDFKCLDDEQQNLIVNTNNEIIENANKEIEKATEKLQENLKYKSILVTNGDELVSVVFNMLETMLSCDLSEFVDEKREDFVIKKEDVTFVGEIKGINTNVKNDNVSQAERHKSSYLDELEEQGMDENVKPLLVINPLRKTELENREPVNEKQVALAKKYDVLIITTSVLLQIYERFVDNKITSEEILLALKDKTGMLEIKDI